MVCYMKLRSNFLWKHMKISELVNEVIKSWDSWLESLSGSDTGSELKGLGSFLEWVSSKLLPMIEHTLWEGTSRGGSSECLGESE